MNMTQVFTFFFLLLGLGTSTEGWLTVKSNVNIAWDLEKTPLEIKTDSKLKSDEKVAVLFLSETGDSAGGVWLKFSTTLQYFLSYCTSPYTDLPTIPPSSVDKVWRITLNRDAGIRVKITCNGKEVLNLLLSDTMCTGYSKWSTVWNRDVEKIMFHPKDTASDGYRPGTAWQCTGLTASWENMETETSFPVAEGTEVSLTCKEGYELKGDDKITCVKDTEFKYSEEPECVAQCVDLNPSWKNMKTDTTFPVTAGTVVKVSCNEGHGLTGSDTVTCTRDTQFEFTTEPKCVFQCSGLTPAWTHMKANTVFPVTAGTKVSLSCESGYGLKGDTSVTCIKNTEFKYDVEPECVSCTGLKDAWKNTMKTTTQFPVAPGTVVKVTCSESQSLLKTGSNELTCTSGKNFGYVTEPKCLPIGNNKGTKA